MSIGQIENHPMNSKCTAKGFEHRHQETQFPSQGANGALLRAFGRFVAVFLSAGGVVALLFWVFGLTTAHIRHCGFLRFAAPAE